MDRDPEPLTKPFQREPRQQQATTGQMEAGGSCLAEELDATPASRLTTGYPLPLVSVVIPCYNQAHYLEEAIQSVMAQTYRHCEIVVIDDGSPDHTAEVAARFPDLRYVRQTNQGLSAARNTGLRHSSGQYIVFLDADDRLLPGAIEAGVRCLEARPECAFAYSNYRQIDSNGAPCSESLNSPVEKDHYLEFLRSNFIGMHATVMYRREILDQDHLFDASLEACEDYDLYLRIARNFPICYHDTMTAEYRMHASNMSNDIELMIRTALTVLCSQWQFVKGDARLEEAFRAGIRGWKEFYGLEQLWRIARHLRAGRSKEILRGVLTLLRYWPDWFAWKIVLRLKRKAKSGLKRLGGSQFV